MADKPTTAAVIHVDFVKGCRVGDAGDAYGTDTALEQLREAYSDLAIAMTKSMPKEGIIEEVVRARNKMRSDIGMVFREDHTYAERLKPREREELVELLAGFMYASKQTIAGKTMYLKEMDQYDVRSKILDLNLQADLTGRRRTRSGIELGGIDNAFRNL